MNEIKTRVLLAEDDENLGSLLQEYLVAKNYETDWVTNGERAFRYFEQYHYDLCIFDVMMPIKDGFTLASEIRLLNSAIPIIFLTAKGLLEYKPIEKESHISQLLNEGVQYSISASVTSFGLNILLHNNLAS